MYAFDGLQVLCREIGMHFGVLIGGNSAGGVVLPSRPAGRTPENRLLTKFARLADMSERFVHQQLHHVLPPDVDDERELRLQHRGVREILLGNLRQYRPRRASWSP